MFTINNPTAADRARLVLLQCSYLVYGEETAPTTGTPHLQGYVELNKRMTINALRKQIPNAHLEKRCGTAQQASAYCKKDGNYTERGTLSQQGKRVDIEKLHADIKAGASDQELWANHFTLMLRYHKSVSQFRSVLNAPTFAASYSLDDFKTAPTLEWNKANIVWGPSDSGKTTFALAHFKNPLLVSHMDDLQTFDSNNHDGIVFDDMDFNHIPRTAQIHLVDTAISRSIHIRYKTALIPAGTKRIFTTNVPDGECLLLSDKAIRRRCNIVHFTELHKKPISPPYIRAVPKAISRAKPNVQRPSGA